MPRLIRIAARGVMEILGLVEPGSPNPRRNTSKEFFEVLLSGYKAETCIRFVSALSPLLTRTFFGSGYKEETRWRRVFSSTWPILNQL